MNEEEKRALKVINARTKRLFDELKIEKEDMSDEPRIAYLMQEIRTNKTVLNLIEKLQKENDEWERAYQEEKDTNFDLIREINRKDNIISQVIKRLENDNIRIKESLQSKWSDDYRKCRLKAYATKTREIEKFIKDNYFGENNKNE